MTASATETGTALVRRYIDAVSALDVDRIVATLHPDVVMHIPFAPEGIPTVVEGKAAVTEWFSAVPNLMAPLNYKDHDIVALEREGEYVARYSGSTTVLPTGNPYSTSYVALFTVRDGLLISTTEYFDAVALVKGLGWTVTPPSGA
ncbi:nuclear transport factor 2 family protein [Pseudonocardia sp. RS010]|uniref:nuclear transport factor 2 family protein n=1 Tax=Pseudonocardia sp. RS010 TaxID=3385979 RepID=UPI0039A134C3